MITISKGIVKKQSNVPGHFDDPKSESILPRWFPTNGNRNQQVWFSDRKVSDVEKNRLMEDTQTSTKMVSASVPSVNVFT